MVIESPVATQLTTGHSLYRGTIRADGLTRPLTTASTPCTRLCALSDDRYAFATGKSVYIVEYSAPVKRSRITDAEDVPRTPSTAVESAIADDYIVPRPFGDVCASPCVAHSAHRAEIQSVEAGRAHLASVDAYGRCIVTICKGDNNETHWKDVQETILLDPVDTQHGEPAWAGLALLHDDPSTVATARQLYYNLTLYDKDVAVRTWHTQQQPFAVDFYENSTGVALAEGTFLSLYDTRSPGYAPSISKKIVQSGRVMAIDASTDGKVIAVAGMDRTVHMFDVRTTSVRDRWTNCLKYEPAAVKVSDENKGMAYVCSVDNEVACGAWSSDAALSLQNAGARALSLMISGANTKSARRAFGFRADTRLIGFACQKQPTESIAVLSEAGALYLLRPHHGG